MHYATYFCLWNVHELWLCLSQLTYYTWRTMCSLSFKSYAVAPLSLWHDQNSRSFSGKITILVCKFPYSHMNMGGGAAWGATIQNICVSVYVWQKANKSRDKYIWLSKWFQICQHFHKSVPCFMCCSFQNILKLDFIPLRLSDLKAEKYCACVSVYLSVSLPWLWELL